MQEENNITGSALVKRQRYERCMKIAAMLNNLSDDYIKSLCLALLIPLQNSQINDLFNQLKKIKEEENVAGS